MIDVKNSYNAINNSTYDIDSKEGFQETPPNPDSSKYQILKLKKFKDFLLVKIKYIDLEGFDSVKILVYNKCTIVNLVEQGSIRPNFSDMENYFSPIAHFKPDDEGWKMAEFFVENFR